MCDGLGKRYERVRVVTTAAESEGFGDLTEGWTLCRRRSSTELHRLQRDCCRCTRNIRRAVSAQPHLAPSASKVGHPTSIHTREKGGKAVQCTRALMNAKHFEEERRRSRLACTDSLFNPVMAMLVLRVAARSVCPPYPAISPLHAPDNLPSHPCDQNTRQHTKSS